MTVIFYDRNVGVGEFYNTVSQEDNLSLLKSYSGWRTSWTHIIPGYAFENSNTDLLFYNSQSGLGEFYSTDFLGNINLLKSATYRTGWTHIVSGTFGGRSYSALLFYNSHSGLAEFYDTDSHGNINLLKSSTYRPGWTLIIPRGIGGLPGYTDLLFYDRNRGVGEFYSTDGHGNINLLSSNTGWRKSWAQIVWIEEVVQ